MDEVFIQIAALLSTVITGSLIIILKKFTSAASSLINSKNEKAQKELKNLETNELLDTARKIWLIVEEDFRIGKNTENTKSEYFDKLLKKSNSALSTREVEVIRQAISGEFNKEKNNLLDEDLKKENITLKNENKQIKDQLAKIEYLINDKGKERKE